MVASQHPIPFDQPCRVALKCLFFERSIEHLSFIGQHDGPLFAFEQQRGQHRFQISNLVAYC